MMVPERLTTAAGSIGVGTAAIEVAASYALKRESFGKKLIEHEGISFKLAESVALLQNASSMVYVASKAADQMEVGKTDLAYVRKLVSIAKLQSTEAMWKIVNDSMQMLGGIGYTTVYPVERLLRDSRLGLIWTGSSEVMKLIIQHEFIKEFADKNYGSTKREIEKDALDFKLEEEKVFN